MASKRMQLPEPFRTMGQRFALGSLGRASALALLAGSAACTTPVDAGPEPDALRDFYEPVARALCEAHLSCCSYGEIDYWISTPFADLDTCVERWMAGTSAGLNLTSILDFPADLQVDYAVVGAVRRGDIRVDEAGLEVCLTYLGAQTCRVPPDFSPANCEPGEVTPTDPCTLEDVFTPTRAPGEPCFGLDAACIDGVCRSTGDDSVCLALGKLDDPCFTGTCADDLQCDLTTGRCTVGGQVGDFCSFVDPDDPGGGQELVPCAEGLECNPDTLQCVPPCSLGTPCLSEFDCPNDTQCILERCRELGLLGAQCSMDEHCVPELYCDGEVRECVVKRPVGDDCISGRECSSGYCETNGYTCAPALDEGDECVSHAQCIDGECRSDPAEPGVYRCFDYADEGDPCDLVARFCDPDAIDPFLECVEDRCVAYPFPEGLPCASAGQCESKRCYENVCVEGGQVGDVCSDTGIHPPCAYENYCETFGESGVDGSCRAIHGPGEYCERDDQCWGSCALRWGRFMCDLTTPPQEGIAVCDGTDAVGGG